MNKNIKTFFKNLSSAEVITLGFAGIIFLGAVLLMLPISSKDGSFTPFLDCLFTSTSAVCVTGLIIYDTFTHWSFFGQLIIISLIQIGGMGVITVALILFLLSGKRISLKQRLIMNDSISGSGTGSIIHFTGFIIKAILMVELCGALLLASRFIPQMGIINGIWAGIFHSISAFCNAGFDLMGQYEQFSSLCLYISDPVVNLTIMALIVVGGIGFIVWKDILKNGFNFRNYKLQSKLVLITTALLLILPAMFFFFYEFNLPQWKEMSIKEKIWASAFQSVTPRTAGFNTVDMTKYSPTSYLITVILMLIGGSPASTAGGFKTTTIAVLILCSISFMKRDESISVFNRRISNDVVNNAVTILFMYIFLLFAGSSIISIVDGLSLPDCVFECASAIATVGLSCGVTAECSEFSRIVLIALMYLGRVGGLTLLFAISRQPENVIVHKPVEDVTIG